MKKVLIVSVLNCVFSLSLLFAESVEKGKYGQYSSVKLVQNAVGTTAIPVVAKNLELTNRKLSKLVKSFREGKKKVAKKALDFIHDRHLSYFLVKEVLSDKKLPRNIYVIFPDANNVTSLQPTHYHKNEEDVFNLPKFNGERDEWLLFLEPVDIVNSKLLPKKLRKSKFFKKRQLYKINSKATAFRLGESLEKRNWDEKIFSVQLGKDIKDLYQLKESGAPLALSLNTMKTGFARKVFDSLVEEEKEELKKKAQNNK